MIPSVLSCCFCRAGLRFTFRSRHAVLGTVDDLLNANPRLGRKRKNQDIPKEGKDRTGLQVPQSLQELRSQGRHLPRESKRCPGDTIVMVTGDGTDHHHHHHQMCLVEERNSALTTRLTF